MWIHTQRGFYSAVAHEKYPDTILVRARFEGDLEVIEEELGIELDIIEGAGTDYRFRCLLPRRSWGDFLASQVKDLDYPNFKNRVALRQGKDRANTYGRVWWVMRDAQGPAGGLDLFFQEGTNDPEAVEECAVCGHPTHTDDAVAYCEVCGQAACVDCSMELDETEVCLSCAQQLEQKLTIGGR